MHCYLCDSRFFSKVPGKVRDLETLSILRCTSCGLVFLDNFSHVNSDFYDHEYTEENHGTHDWDAFLNECAKDDQRRFSQIQALIANRAYLDVGCGAGGVLLRAQKVAKHATGVEPQWVWRKALNSAGVDVAASLAEVENASQNVISLFHVLEHIADPLAFIRDLLKKAAPSGRLVIEVPNADDALLSLYENKPFSEFTYWSPHLFLYSHTTLSRLLEKAGIDRNQIAISQYQRYPLSNHLMWLAQGRPGGHMQWSFLDSPALDEAYAARLATLGRCDTLIAWVSL